jgi:hypothetical protein
VTCNISRGRSNGYWVEAVRLVALYVHRRRRRRGSRMADIPEEDLLRAQTAGGH